MLPAGMLRPVREAHLTRTGDNTGRLVVPRLVGPTPLWICLISIADQYLFNSQFLETPPLRLGPGPWSTLALSQAFLGPTSPVLPSSEMQAAAITAAWAHTPWERIFPFLKDFNSFSTTPCTKRLTILPSALTPRCTGSHSLPVPRRAVPLQRILSGPECLLWQLLGQAETPNSPQGAILPGLPTTPQVQERFRGGVRASADSSYPWGHLFPPPAGPGLPCPAWTDGALRVGRGRPRPPAQPPGRPVP